MTKLDFNTTFIARHIYVEAMRISADVEVADGGFLSPHDVSHAAIAGWLLGNNYRDFRVVGDERPFGIEYLDKDRNKRVAEPGEWLLLTGYESLTSMSHDAFVSMYETYEAPVSEESDR